MGRSANPKKFLSAEESARVAKAIEEAERRTSAEIKLVIVRHSWGDIKVKAARAFRKMGLDRTELRNCVLIMLVTTNREFLVYGDQGIHEKVGQGFWDDVRSLMAEKFAAGEFAKGLAGAVKRAGEKLAEYFPNRADDRNEISDEVAYED